MNIEQSFTDLQRKKLVEAVRQEDKLGVHKVGD